MTGKRGGRALGVLALAVVGVTVRAWAGDWPAYRHDAQGTSNAGEPLTTAQAAGLRQAWIANAAPIANPVVAGGAVYVTTTSGRLTALDAATGAVRWSASTGVSGTFTCGGMTMGSTFEGPIGAAAVVGSRVFFPGGDGAVYAFDAASGATLWRTTIADPLHGNELLWSSAFALHGKVYVGVGALFEEDCGENPGRVVVLDQASGAIVGTWWATADHSGGGGIWTQPAYDPATNRMFVATGNPGRGVSAASQPLTQSIVAFDADSLQTLDHFQGVSTDFFTDWDYGSSPVLYDVGGRAMVAVTNKNGFVHAFDRNNLAAGLAWQYQVSGPGTSPDLGEGSIVSPTFANGRLFVAGGATTDGFPGKIAALDPATGQELWSMHPNGFVLPAMTAVGDVVLVGLSNASTQQGGLLVLSQANGQVVFQQATPANVFAEPTWANGVLYYGDTSTGLRALVPPAGGTTTTTASSSTGTTGSTSGSTGTTGSGGGSTFHDSFNRSGALGSSWSVAAGAFTDNGSAATATAQHSYAFWVGSPASDAVVGVTLSAPANTWAGVTMRGQDGTPDANHYAAYIDPSGVVGLAKRSGYAYSYLGSGPTVSAGSHRIDVRATGTNPLTLSVRLDGVEVIRATDTSPFGPGAAGIFDYNGIAIGLDEFDVGTGTGGTTASSTSTSTSTTGTTGTSSSSSSSTSSSSSGTTGGGSAFHDSFNRSGALGSNWSVAAGAFTDNGSAATATAQHSYAFWVGSPASDATVGITLSAPANTWAGVVVRGQAGAPDASHYAAYIDPSGVVGLAKRSGYAYSYLGSGPTVGAGNHRLELQATGTGPVTLSVRLDGVEVIRVTDASSPFGAGAAGIFDYNGIALALDEFDVSAGTSGGGTSGGTTGGSAGHHPVATITGGPFTGTAPYSVFLDGTTSRTQDAGGWIASYRFDFGDGTSAVQGYGSHTYQAAGRYTVTLTVTDDTGATASTTQVITVNAP